MAGGRSAGPGLARDMRPPCRGAGVAGVDVGLDPTSVDDVRARAEAILTRVEEGAMPCDAMWPEERVALLRAWIETGMAP